MADSDTSKHKASAAPLGIYAESSSPPPESQVIQGLRAERYNLQDHARGLLMTRGVEQYQAGAIDHPANIHRTAKCLHIQHSAQVEVYKSLEHNKAFFGGLVVCGNVWTCPVCAAKVEERRRLEISQMFEHVYERSTFGDSKVVMVTFTFSHSIADSLKDLLWKQADAFRRLRSGKVWQRIKKKYGYQGLIRSLELTDGENGWHPHTHEAWIVRADADIEEMKAEITNRWFNICEKLGLVGGKPDAFRQRSVHIQDECHASDYFAKQDDSRHWGADRELAKASTKQGKKSGRHPFMLLKLFEEGDGGAGQRFLEYAFAMRGKSRLFWSRGLKDACGINDVDDETLATEQTDYADLLGLLTSGEWEVVRKARAKADLLNAAENGGLKAVRDLVRILEAHATDSSKHASDSASNPTSEVLALASSPLSVEPQDFRSGWSTSRFADLVSHAEFLIQPQGEPYQPPAVESLTQALARWRASQSASDARRP